jgi:hypothetical protein
MMAVPSNLSSPADSVPLGSALSYPYIHMREFERVAAALLYWDSVRRIVPPSVRTGNHANGDNDDARLFADEELFIAIDPTPYEEAAAEQFFKHIEPRVAQFQITPDEAREYATEERGLHVEKLGVGVLARLQSMKLAQQVGEWVGMHDEVGSLYMYYLASEVSKKTEAPLLAASDKEAAFGEALLFEPKAEADVTDDLLRLGISFPSPKDLANRQVTAQAIVEFSKKRAAERIAFRDAVHKIIAAARNKDDPHALNTYLAKNAVVIADVVSNLRKTLDELHVGAAKSTAVITIPTGFSAALAVAPISPPAAATLAAIGIAISAIACWAETRGKLRTARVTSPYHYLLSIEKEFPVH